MKRLVFLFLAALLTFSESLHADGYCYIGYVYDAAGQRVKRYYYCVEQPDDPCYDCPDEPPPPDSRPAGSSATSVAPLEGRSIKTATVFPSPTPGPFVLVVPAALQPCEVAVMNASGSVIQRVKIVDEETEFDLTAHVPGSYYLRLVSAGGKPQFFKITKR